MTTTQYIEPCYILLGIDGVLNPHTRHENGYCGIDRECVRNFNTILEAVSHAKICLISSWRYDVHAGRMTIGGVEAMLLTHGVDCHGRVVGVTVSDEEIVGQARSWEWLKKYGARIRRSQVHRWLWGEWESPQEDDRRYVVLDDIDLALPNGGQVVTDPNVGLTAADAQKAISILCEVSE